uniref:Uncharacterized protein n=1 Tax=Arion vulgaris TaxID=1028688 RepID=A0A0B7ACA2_9EUPU
MAYELAKTRGNLKQSHLSQIFKKVKILVKQYFKMEWRQVNENYKPEQNN